jgi:hypothetical protein
VVGNLRKLIFCVAVVAFIGMASSDGETYTTDYGSSVEMDNPATQYRDDVRYEGCGGEKYDVSPVGGTTTVKIPKGLPCGLGEHDIDVYYQRRGTTDYVYKYTHTLNVEAFNMGDPNNGDYLILRLRGGSYGKARDMFMTEDDPLEGDNHNRIVEDNDQNPTIPPGAYFHVTSEFDRTGANLYRSGVMRAVYGEIYAPDESGFRPSSSSIPTSHTFDDPDEGWYNDASGGVKEFIWDVTEEPFDSGKNIQYGKKYNGCKIGTQYPIGAETTYGFNDCTPVHANGKWEPQGEIIVATDPDKGLYSGDYPKDYETSGKTDFFICRGDYMGATPEESKIVEVRYPSSDNVYWRCADGTNDPEGDWVVPECPPGQEIRQIGTDYECNTKQDKTISVQMFDIENVPESNKMGPLIGGFKVESSEIDKFSNVLGTQMDTVEAECWMGEDDERPSDAAAANSVRITYDINYGFMGGVADAWVLGKIPWRDSYDTGTYSCIYGFTANTATPGSDTVLESTRNSPLLSVEASRPTINHSEIKDRYDSYNSFISEESDSSRDIWDKYSGDDDRPDIGVDDEDMIDYTNAYPYCNPPPSGTNIFDHIIC